MFYLSNIQVTSHFHNKIYHHMDEFIVDLFAKSNKSSRINSDINLLKSDINHKIILCLLRSYILNVIRSDIVD